MKRFCIAILGLAVAAAAALSCAGDTGKVQMATPSATSTPAVVGPVLLYTETSLGDANAPPVDTLVAYDTGANREVRRAALPAEARAKTLTKSGTLIYVAALSGSFEIRAIDPLTGDERRLYRAPDVTEWSIAVSPDGNQVAFAEIAAPGNAVSPPDTAVRILDVRDGSTRTVATFQDPISGAFRGRPVPRVWRDDGRGFVVSGDTSSGAPGGSATIMTDGTVINHLQGFGWPSPNGRYLALQDLDDTGCVIGDVQRLRIFSLDGASVVAEVDDPARGIVMDDWSPDGQALSYRRYAPKPGTATNDCIPDYDPASVRRFTLNVAGGDPVAVTDFNALQRAWYGDRVVELRCGDGSAPDSFGKCADPLPRSILLNGVFVAKADVSGILGFIDTPAQ